MPFRLMLAFAGSLFGLAVTGLVLTVALGNAGGLPLLVAPIGASAVLLFAVPASPLAQPWPIIGGNTLSALVGIACMQAFGDLMWAAGLATASAIVLMSLARCLHPPGGAVALIAVVGGPAIAHAGWSFALFPVAVNSVLLVGLGLLFNAATRGNYPHRAPAMTMPPPTSGYTIGDIEAVLEHSPELLDISAEDLDMLFRLVEEQARRRQGH